jgi:YjjG family noncanonical pyrimidine nucleotidase
MHDQIARPDTPARRSGSTPYEWLLFDADGTLFDYERGEATALRRSFEEIGVAFREPYLAHYRAINEAVWRDLEKKLISPATLKVRRFEQLLEAIGVVHSPADFSEIYLRSLAACSELIDGAEEVLRLLHAHYRLAILTNGLSTVQRGRLTRSVVGDFIAQLVISEEVGAAKPDAEFFELAFARLGQPPKTRVLMIGDNWTSDIQGAADYGLDTCWFNPRRLPRPPQPAITREIAALPELIPWLGLANAVSSC